jgi:carboxyl-terminal processing protease
MENELIVKNSKIETDIPKQKKSHILRKILIFLFFLLFLASAFQAGLIVASKNEIVKETVAKEYLYLGKVLGLYNSNKPNYVSQDVDFNLFWKVWDDLKNSFVDKEKLNDKKMFYGALRGLVSSLGDPYTVFMDPVIAENFNNDLAGTFEGIGAEIGLKNDVITIIAPLPDMPAEKAGLKSGDKILSINGESTTNMTVEEAVSKIKGPKGTQVILSVYRDGFENFKEFKITRSTIIIKSVRTKLNDDKMLVVQITNFNDDTDSLFNEAVSEAIKDNPKGIILDLRNNPGGYLDTAIEMASEWIEDGVIVTEKYSEEKKIEHLARGRARLKGFKTVVLVNQGSASASEIVSGALQDYKDAAIIGMKTFGKGSVQTLLNLDDGSSVKITIAKWLTPKGRSINDEGIMPDYEVDLTLENFNANKDPQMEAAVKYLQGENIDSYLVKNNATSTESIKK